MLASSPPINHNLTALNKITSPLFAYTASFIAQKMDNYRRKERPTLDFFPFFFSSSFFSFFFLKSERLRWNCGNCFLSLNCIGPNTDYYARHLRDKGQNVGAFPALHWGPTALRLQVTKRPGSHLQPHHSFTCEGCQTRPGPITEFCASCCPWWARRRWRSCHRSCRCSRRTCSWCASSSGRCCRAAAAAAAGSGGGGCGCCLGRCGGWGRWP